MKWIELDEETTSTPSEQKLVSGNSPYGFDIKKPEGYLDTIKRLGAGSGAAAARGISKFVAGAGDFALGIDQALRASSGQPTLTPEQRSGLELYPKIQQTEESISENLPEGHLKPQNAAEDWLYSISERLPTAALSGGKSLWNMGLNAIKSATGAEVGKRIAQKLGAGTFGEIVGEFLGSTGAGALRPTKVKQALNTMRTSLYENVGKLTKNRTINAHDIESFIEKAYKPLERGAKNIEWKSKARTHLEDLTQNISEGKIGLDDIWEAKKDFNKLARETKSKEAKAVYTKVADYLTDKLSSEGSKIPGFKESFPKAESLTKLINTAEDMYLPVEETVRSILKSTRLGKLYTAGVSRPFTMTKNFLKDPTARKYYYETYGNALLGNKPAALSAGEKLLNYQRKTQQKKNPGLEWIELD